MELVLFFVLFSTAIMSTSDGTSKEMEGKREEMDEQYAELYKAVTKGDATRVTEFIQKGLDVNYDYKEHNQRHPTSSNLCRFLLTEAIVNEQTKIANILLYNNANINSQDEDGTTPLMQAIYMDSLSLVQLILSHGATIEIEDNQKRTALHLAAQLNRANIIEAIIQLKRLTHPQLVDSVNSEENTPLLIAVKAGHFAACDALILRGADPNKPDRNGRYPLHHAVIAGNERLIKYLLRNLAFPYKIDKMGVLPIALTTVPTIISYLEDAYSQYSPEFRVFEELAVTSGLSRLLRYQFIHLLHSYEDFRRQRHYSSLTFDLAAAMVSEDWDAVQKLVLNKLQQAADSGIVATKNSLGAAAPTTTPASFSPLPMHGFSVHPEKSILVGCFFSYDTHEFYKQTLVVLQGVTSCMHTLSKECLSGQLHLTELYACAQVRQKLQSFIVASSPIMQVSNAGTTTTGAGIQDEANTAISTCLSNAANSPVPPQVTAVGTQQTKPSTTTVLPGDNKWSSRDLMATPSFDMHQHQQQLRRGLGILHPPATTLHVSPSVVTKQQTQPSRESSSFPHAGASDGVLHPAVTAIPIAKDTATQPPLIIAAIPTYSSTRARSTALMKGASLKSQSSDILSDHNLSVRDMEEDAVVVKNLLQLKAPSSDTATESGKQQVIVPDPKQSQAEKDQEQQPNEEYLDALSTITVASSSSSCDTIEENDNKIATDNNIEKEDNDAKSSFVPRPPTPTPSPVVPDTALELNREKDKSNITSPKVTPTTVTQAIKPTSTNISKSKSKIDTKKASPISQPATKTDLSDESRPHAIVAEAFTRKRSRQAATTEESKTLKRQKQDKVSSTAEKTGEGKQ